MLYIRPYKRCDAATIAAWTGDERAHYMWSAGRLPFPLTAEALDAHYEGYADSDSFFPLTAFDGEGLAGHLIMRWPSPDRRELRLGFVIVDPARRGRGLGRELVSRAADYAFHFLGAERVTLGVFEDNPAAHRCYLSAGFRETGKRSVYPHNGKNWGCIELELLK